MGSKNDADEILKHKFFKGINIQKIIDRKFKAPFQPPRSESGDFTADPEVLMALMEEE